MAIILDPGHGLSNRDAGVYDPGAVAGGVTEAGVAMIWANELRSILLSKGQQVVRTRVDFQDSAPLRERAKIAKKFAGKIMLSIHCNSRGGTATGTETFYRGPENKALATLITKTTCTALSTKNRGAKLEAESQHKSLAIMAFQPCFLLELGFIDHPLDRQKMVEPEMITSTCTALAEILINHLKKI